MDAARLLASDAGAVSAFLADALARTLEDAVVDVPYYRDRLGGRAAVELADFALIDRGEVRDHFFELISTTQFPDYLVMSGGTTGDIVNATIRNESEYEAIHEFLTGYRPGEVPSPADLDGFGVDVFFNTNGYSRRKARGWPLVSIPLERKSHVDLVERLLAAGFPLAGRTLPARYVQAQNALHRVLAGYFAAAGRRPEAPALDGVFGYGSHVSRVWRERLVELWGLPLETTYGLSEFVGCNAVPCASCGALHHLTAWAEFLSPADLSPVAGGDALLVLTSLAPFVVAQPRIRYLTGDLVSVAGRCADTGLLGFRFRGRSAFSVWAPSDDGVTVLLSEVDVLEAVDRIAEVRVRRHPSEIQLWEDAELPPPPFPLGLPQFSVSGSNLCESRRADVRVEVDFDLELDQARARKTEERLTELLLAEAPGLAARVAAGDAMLAVDAVPARALRLPAKTGA